MMLIESSACALPDNDEAGVPRPRASHFCAVRKGLVQGEFYFSSNYPLLRIKTINTYLHVLV